MKQAFNLRRTRTAFGVAGCSLVLAPFVVLTAAAEADSNQRQPVGVRINEFLRHDVTPTEWAERAVPYHAAINECMDGVAGAPANPSQPAVGVPTDDLRVSDPAAFEAKYSYGIALQLTTASAEALEKPTVVEPPSTDYVDAFTECEQSAKSIMDEYGAPPEVFRRYSLLLELAAGSETYRRAAFDWNSCMSNEGLHANSPLAPPSDVYEYAMNLAGVGSNELPASSTERPIFLEPSQLESVAQYEAEVHGVDQVCRSQSGLDDVMYDLETEIVSQLTRDFPSYNPDE